MKYASFGTVIHATHRPEDLIPAFTDELEYQVQRNAEHWLTNPVQRDSLVALVWDARENADYSDAEYSWNMINDLTDALQHFAAPWSYFGTHPGDGSDYGFWVDLEMLDYDFDGLKVSDLNEIPDDYIGEALHINDHGNITLYRCESGKLSEIWAIA